MFPILVDNEAGDDGVAFVLTRLAGCIVRVDRHDGTSVSGEVKDCNEAEDSVRIHPWAENLSRPFYEETREIAFDQIKAVTYL